MTDDEDEDSKTYLLEDNTR